MFKYRFKQSWTLSLSFAVEEWLVPVQKSMAGNKRSKNSICQLSRMFSIIIVTQWEQSIVALTGKAKEKFIQITDRDFCIEIYTEVNWKSLNRRVEREKGDQQKYDGLESLRQLFFCYVKHFFYSNDEFTLFINNNNINSPQSIYATSFKVKGKMMRHPPL